MSKSTIDRYLMLCRRLRRRIETAEGAINSGYPEWQVVETIALQGRKAIETIAHMCLVATEHGLGELGIPKDAKKHWNAETIFERLQTRNIHVLPSPSRMTISLDKRFKAVFSGVKENRLTYAELIAMYRSFHGVLHEDNPYRVMDMQTTLQEASNAIQNIRRFVWIHFIAIKGKGFAVDLKNDHGVTAIVSCSLQS